MGSKAKRHGKRSSVVELFEQAQRRFEKRHFKEAYKDAKVCYRQEPTDQHRRLLERAWFARARELSLAGLRLDSRGMLEDLLDFGVTEPSVQEGLPELLLAVGLFDRMGAGRAGPAVDVDAGLLATAADHAVLMPAEASASLPGIRQGAAGIRAALDVLYAGDEPAALAPLKDISRGSPFADWRYFVRGLAAYYREDLAETAANWDRLDPARLAARIARPLRALADPTAPGQDDPQVRNAARILESQVSGQPVILGLFELKSCLAEERWKELVRALRRWRGALGQFSPEIIERVTALCFRALLVKGEAYWLNELTSAAAPLPIDPRWNRAWAMLWERPDQFRPAEAERRWRAYLEDLADLRCLTPPERIRARALVWMRIGQLCVHAHAEGDDSWDDAEDWDSRDEPHDSAPSLQARAVECLAKSIELDPGLLAAREELAQAYLEWDDREMAAEAYRRLLERFPDHLDALRFLIQHHQRRDEYLLAREYALRALRLKPTNQEIIASVWAGHVGAARHYALRGEWDKGRAEFDAAEKLNATHCEPYVLLARKAAFELKAGNDALGRALAEEAKAQLEHPAPALLVLTIEATRYGLPYRVDSIAADFERAWSASLRRKRLSATAGRMSRTLASYLVANVKYPGRQAHVDRVLGYLRGCTRIRWQCDDLRVACDFVHLARDADASADVTALLEKLVRRACKSFPESPAFFLMAGNLEVDKGPVRCNRRYAKQCFERAAEAAKKSTAAADAEIAERAQAQLAFLDALGRNRPPRFTVPPLSFFADGEESFEDDDDESSDEYEGPAPQVPRGKLFGMFAKVCASMGLDPQEVLERMGGGVPFRFRHEEDDGPAPSERTRKPTRQG